MLDIQDDYRAMLDDEERREAAITALVNDDKQTIAGLINSDSFLDSILRNGHEGYENLSDIDLQDELDARGLTL